ncbi:hypothetical protein [Arachnia propionica]|nr:hypothetical protein [Arachnia propionica]QUC14616.1 hypothetical protein J5A61_02355 [Arachnia propionica]
MKAATCPGRNLTCDLRRKSSSPGRHHQVIRSLLSCTESWANYAAVLDDC